MSMEISITRENECERPFSSLLLDVTNSMFTDKQITLAYLFTVTMRTAGM